MTSFQWFSLSLRIIGAWTVVTGLEFLGTAYNTSHGLGSGAGYSTWAYINQTIIHLAIGILLLKLAPTFARFAYPLPKEPHGAAAEQDSHD